MTRQSVQLCHGLSLLHVIIDPLRLGHHRLPHHVRLVEIENGAAHVSQPWIHLLMRGRWLRELVVKLGLVELVMHRLGTGVHELTARGHGIQVTGNATRPGSVVHPHAIIMELGRWMTMRFAEQSRGGGSLTGPVCPLISGGSLSPLMLCC